MSGVIVEVSGRKVWFPFECPCCGGYPDTELRTRRTGSARRLLRRRSKGITVPYCRRCVAHTERWTFAERAAIGTIAGAVMLGGVVAYSGAIAIGVVACALGVAGGLAVKSWQRGIARAHSKHSCVQPDETIACLRRSRNGGMFVFASRRYAAKFAIQNARHLVNVGRELLELIEHYRTRGDSGQLPAQGPPDERPPSDPGELGWITAKPERPRRRWWHTSSSVSGTDPTQLSA